MILELVWFAFGFLHPQWKQGHVSLLEDGRSCGGDPRDSSYQPVNHSASCLANPELTTKVQHNLANTAKPSKLLMHRILSLTCFYYLNTLYFGAVYSPARVTDSTLQLRTSYQNSHGFSLFICNVWIKSTWGCNHINKRTFKTYRT